MSMQGNAEIRVGASLAKSVGTQLQQDLNKIAKTLTLNISKVKLQSQQYQKSMIEGTKRAIVQQTKTLDAINNMFAPSSVNLKQTQQTYQQHFDKIGTVIQKSKVTDAINNISKLSNKNAKESANAFTQAFKEAEQATSGAMAKNKLFEQWFMPQQGKNLPTASTSAFGLTQGEMGSKNKNFEQWFIPKSISENINSAKSSMSAFTEQVSKGAVVYDRYGNVSKQASENFRNLNQELINSTRNQFSFGNMLTQGIKKMLVWSN